MVTLLLELVALAGVYACATATSTANTSARAIVLTLIRADGIAARFLQGSLLALDGEAKVRDRCTARELLLGVFAIVVVTPEMV